jgi:hypothetical protein
MPVLFKKQDLIQNKSFFKCNCFLSWKVPRLVCMSGKWKVES